MSGGRWNVRTECQLFPHIVLYRELQAKHGIRSIFEIYELQMNAYLIEISKKSISVIAILIKYNIKKKNFIQVAYINRRRKRREIKRYIESKLRIFMLEHNNLIYES